METKSQFANSEKISYELLNGENLTKTTSLITREQVKIEWINLNYSIQVKDTKQSTFMKTAYKYKKIIDNMSGSAKSGELLAILGPTGCGKTSLLNCLAARIESSTSSISRLTGRILVNGANRSDTAFRKISAYVLQDDKLYPQLTVLETLTLAAQFYLPTSMPDEKKRERALQVLTELGLIKVKNTCIGDERRRGVSGGERKRCNIGVQLISDPAVLFLDEPTSGLDAFQAQAVMQAMRDLAHSGRLVISVIHQPRSSIFDMFDQLLLLSCGRTMYMGPAVDGARWFAQHGLNCPRLFNPADYFLDILSPDNRSPERDRISAAQIDRLGNAWLEYIRTQETDSNPVPPTPAGYGLLSPHPLVIVNNETLPRLAKNFTLLYWRSFSEVIRDNQTNTAKFVTTVIFACIIGAIYNRVGNSQNSITNRTGLLFVICLNMSFNSTLGVLNSFPKEKIIVNRERAANAYDSFSYFVAKLVSELPTNVLPALLFGCILYWIVGLQPGRFGQFLGIIMLEALTGIALGLAVSAFAPSIDAANALGPPLVVVALIFGGFLINLDSLPIVANWIPYLSFIRWAFEALCINEFTGLTFVCDGEYGACFQTGEEVLVGLSFANKTVSDALFGLGMVLLGFMVSAYWFLFRSKATFLALGHIGRKCKKIETTPTSALVADNAPATSVLAAK